MSGMLPSLAFTSVFSFCSHSKATPLCVKLISHKSFASKFCAKLLHRSILVDRQPWQDLGRGIIINFDRNCRALCTDDFYSLGKFPFIRLFIIASVLEDSSGIL